MKKKISALTIFTIILLMPLFIVAQEKILQGAISTLNDIPLSGVSIKIQSSKQVILSDSSGNFSVNCNSNDKLKISADGFYPQKIKLSDTTEFVIIKLKMKSGMNNFEKAVNYVNPLDVSKLKIQNTNNNEVDFSIYDTIYDLVIGKLTGVYIVNGEFQMRGTRSITGSNAALVLVDGVPTSYGDISTISPIQVKSIRVLRGSEVAIFGSEAGNGVIAIETKQSN